MILNYITSGSNISPFLNFCILMYFYSLFLLQVKPTENNSQTNCSSSDILLNKLLPEWLSACTESLNLMGRFNDCMQITHSTEVLTYYKYIWLRVKRCFKNKMKCAEAEIMLLKNNYTWGKFAGGQLFTSLSDHFSVACSWAFRPESLRHLLQACRSSPEVCGTHITKTL